MPRKKAQSDAARSQDKTDTPLEEAAGPVAAAEEVAAEVPTEGIEPAAEVEEEVPAAAVEAPVAAGEAPVAAGEAPVAAGEAPVPEAVIPAASEVAAGVEEEAPAAQAEAAAEAPTPVRLVPSRHCELIHGGCPATQNVRNLRFVV